MELQLEVEAEGCEQGPTAENRAAVVAGAEARAELGPEWGWMALPPLMGAGPGPGVPWPFLCTPPQVGVPHSLETTELKR